MSRFEAWKDELEGDAKKWTGEVVHNRNLEASGINQHTQGEQISGERRWESAERKFQGQGNLLQAEYNAAAYQDRAGMGPGQFDPYQQQQFGGGPGGGGYGYGGGQGGGGYNDPYQQQQGYGGGGGGGGGGHHHHQQW